MVKKEYIKPNLLHCAKTGFGRCYQQDVLGRELRQRDFCG